MCGIAGFFGNFSDDLLLLMGESLNHRGPDGQGEVLFPVKNQRVGLAHRRLSIIDLSPAGAQPMPLEVGQSQSSRPELALWITFNGEIYNFPELKRELESLGHRFKSRTDTEVILHLYAEWGLEGFSRLNGIFSIGLYDGRERGQKDGIKKGDLLLIRDGMGVKPLYYAETSLGFLFASEIKSILYSKEVSKDLDLVSLKNCISYLYSPAPRTSFQSIKKVEPGQWILVREGRVHLKKYFYDIPFGRPVIQANEKEVARELENKLKEAVKRQLISDVPVGAFLSGGMDSSSVVALMREAAPSTPFQCFTIGHKDDQNEGKNDLHYAKELASQLKLPLQIVNVEPSDFNNLEKTLFHLDEPQADPAAINTMLISRKARELGIKVLLSGAGGDDIFSGYPRHAVVELENIWKWIPSPVLKSVASATLMLSQSSEGVTMVRDRRLRQMAKVLASLAWDKDRRLSSYFMSTFPDSIIPILGERFKTESLELTLEENSFISSLARIKNEKSIVNRMLYLECKHFLADHNLNYVDKMSMSQGVEVRVPLIDLELVNFMASVPPHLKRKNFENKYIFKKAVRSYVPEAILRRPKHGFGLPIRQWLNNELRDLVQESLSERSLKNRGLFNPSQVLRLIKMDQEKKIDATFLIFSLLSIELWCRQFVDKSYSTVHSKERVAALPL